MLHSMTATQASAAVGRSICHQYEKLTVDKKLLTPGQVEQQLECREAQLLSEKLLLSRGLNPDHESMLGRILHEHFLQQVQQRKQAGRVGGISAGA